MEHVKRGIGADAEAMLLDVRAVAVLLNCSQRHVYRMADAGKMPQPVRVGTLVRWSRNTLEDWISGGCLPVRVQGRGNV
ncbi:MAG: helix-turn-helix domain-containing protein [Candidatus Hydrogenedentes bacterium]|nr:helix-turn-helix domain-containing protein [Candidatus Hydrogenedentota bacterium]